MNPLLFPVVHQYHLMNTAGISVTGVHETERSGLELCGLVLGGIFVVICPTLGLLELMLLLERY